MASTTPTLMKKASNQGSYVSIGWGTFEMLAYDSGKPWSISFHPTCTRSGCSLFWSKVLNSSTLGIRPHLQNYTCSFVFLQEHLKRLLCSNDHLQPHQILPSACQVLNKHPTYPGKFINWFGFICPPPSHHLSITFLLKSTRFLGRGMVSRKGTKLWNTLEMFRKAEAEVSSLWLPSDVPCRHHLR